MMSRIVAKICSSCPFLLGLYYQCVVNILNSYCFKLLAVINEGEAECLHFTVCETGGVGDDD